jgi:hypothetical protein
MANQFNTNNLFFLRITAIYSSASARKCVIIYLLLYFGGLTLLFMSLGSEVGGIDGLSQVTKLFYGFEESSVFTARGAPLGPSGPPGENLVAAAEQLTGIAGVYCFKNLVTGTLYIGSSMYLANRIKSHIFRSSNIHLRNAFKKHGLSKFPFIIVEFTELNEEIPEDVISKALQEQHWLDWLFSLPASMRYNFRFPPPPTGGGEPYSRIFSWL